MIDYNKWLKTFFTIYIWKTLITLKIDLPLFAKCSEALENHSVNY